MIWSKATARKHGWPLPMTRLPQSRENISTTCVRANRIPPHATRGVKTSFWRLARDSPESASHENDNIRVLAIEKGTHSRECPPVVQLILTRFAVLILLILPRACILSRLLLRTFLWSRPSLGLTRLRPFLWCRSSLGLT